MPLTISSINYATLILSRGHLLADFGKFRVSKKATNLENQIGRQIFDTTIFVIENEFYNSMDIIATAGIDDNEMEA